MRIPHLQVPQPTVVVDGLSWVVSLVGIRDAVARAGEQALCRRFPRYGELRRRRGGGGASGQRSGDGAGRMAHDLLW